jgi:hypothetical protein
VSGAGRGDWRNGRACVRPATGPKAGAVSIDFEPSGFGKAANPKGEHAVAVSVQRQSRIDPDFN